MTNNIALIPARAGSKGIPNKNFAMIGGKPLICHSIEHALASRDINHIVVSSDSDRILSIAKSYGESVLALERPLVLARDDTETLAVVQFVIGQLEHLGVQSTQLVLLQPTSPLRPAGMIDQCLSNISESGSTSLISVSEPIQHPADCFVWKDGRYNNVLCNRGVNRRQDFPKVVFANGSVYISRVQYIMTEQKLINYDDCIFYEVEKKFGIDIDTEFDLKLADFFIGLGV